MDRAAFLRLVWGGVAGMALPTSLAAAAGSGPTPGRYDFWFTRLRYVSGDWDVDQRMPVNLLTSLVDYTTLRVEADDESGACRLSLGGSRETARRP